MSADRVDGIDSYSLGTMVLRLFDCVNKDGQELAVVKSELILDMEDYGDEALKQLLLSLEVLLFKSLNYLIGDPLNLFVEHFVRAVDDDLG